MPANEYDYIIVGAGSAGCVIAAHIMQQGGASVLLLEAGGTDDNLLIRMPAGVARIIAQKTWPYTVEPAPETLNRALLVPQGKVLGGSSSVNGMIYMRGHREDYDGWVEDHGCTGWGFDDLLPYFKRSEANESLTGHFHGDAGMLPVSENRYRHPLSMAFVRAGQQCGLPYVNDFNGAAQQGVGFYQTTTRRGERASASRTYLQSIRDKPGFDLVLDALVEHIVIERHKATGVQYRPANGAPATVSARKEVIVCAGALGSSRLLMLSGIGPHAHLESLGIPVLADLPVGRHFKDHLHLSINAETRDPISLYGQDGGLNALRNGVNWLVFRQGPIASNILEAGAFVDTHQEGRPDIQIHFLPMLDTWDDPEGVGKGRTHGLTLKVGHLRPRSEGEVQLRSKDPTELPRIRAGFLTHPDDLPAQMRAARLGQDFLRTQAMSPLISDIFSPDPRLRDDDAALEQFVRANVKTTYHPIGTCRMGPDPTRSVVDLMLRVHGIEGLRVADSSIFPDLPSGNTNAPVIAIAEKAADLILGKTPLQPAAPA